MASEIVVVVVVVNDERMQIQRVSTSISPI